MLAQLRPRWGRIVGSVGALLVACLSVFASFGEPTFLHPVSALEFILQLLESPRSLRPVPDRTGDQWVTRTVAANGVVCVDWQQVSAGKHFSGSRCDVLVDAQILQFWVGNQLLKTVERTSSGEIHKKRASGTGRRRREWSGGVKDQPE